MEPYSNKGKHISIQRKSKTNLSFQNKTHPVMNSFNQSGSLKPTSQFNEGEIKRVRTVNSPIKNAQLTGKDSKDKGDDLIRQRIIKHHIHSPKQLQGNNNNSLNSNKHNSRTIEQNTINSDRNTKLNYLIGNSFPSIIDSLSFMRSEKKSNKIFIQNKYSQLF